MEKSKRNALQISARAASARGASRLFLWQALFSLLFYALSARFAGAGWLCRCGAGRYRRI
jgi:hypothetical protein